MHQCAVCREPASRRCSECTVSTAWYCGAVCQEGARIEHIFECNLKRPITTADRLVLAVVRNHSPKHAQTREDYGFNRALSPQNCTRLLGLYTGLVLFHNISAQTIHEWRVQGRLIEEIKAIYEPLSPAYRSVSYAWFLQNLWILDRTKAAPVSDLVAEMYLRANRYAGIGDCDSKEETGALVGQWPKNKQACYWMCWRTLSHWLPGPFEDAWVTFGFCACRDEDEEVLLGSAFRRLLEMCTFDEFYAAYESSTLFALFERHGLAPDCRCIADFEHILAGSPVRIESVWFLKQFIIVNEANPKQPGVGFVFPLSVYVDYGFYNCESEALMKQLKNAYRKLFLQARVAPLELHKACIEGQLFPFTCQHIKLNERQKKRFSALMKNLYPLPLSLPPRAAQRAIPYTLLTVFLGVLLSAVFNGRLSARSLI